jgi:hypothetical protein
MLAQITNIAPKAAVSGEQTTVKAMQQNYRSDGLESSTQTVQLIFGNLAVELETTQQKWTKPHPASLEITPRVVEIWLVLPSTR